MIFIEDVVFYSKDGKCKMTVHNPNTREESEKMITEFAVNNCVSQMQKLMAEKICNQIVTVKFKER
jgi:hypothetical protein